MTKSVTLNGNPTQLKLVLKTPYKEKLWIKVKDAERPNTYYTIRYGFVEGQKEFVVLMPNTPDKSAYEVLDKIREVVAKSALKFKGEPLNISISFGITAVREKETIESAFERADSALYQAKEQGRNRSVLSAEHDAPKE